MTAMTEYKIGNAVVRMHGECDREKLKEATTIFLKKAEAQRRKNKKK